MIRTLEGIDRAALDAFDEIIDVRSPAEFAEDHVPGAINLPVLDNGERAVVGTIYVQQSRFEARRLGAAIVARNIARHLDEALRAKGPGFAPLIYCWRGGQRSSAMATVLDQVGWRPTVLNGGYKTYRRHVRALLDDVSRDLRLILLSGHTGTAKTEILCRAKTLGAQVLDLEGLAAHRGSLLGEIADRSQPSQTMFESVLATAISTLDPTKPVLVEAESSKIGDLNIPEPLWRAMSTSSMIELRASVAARATYLVCAYRDLTADPERLIASISRLPGRHGRAAVERWLGYARGGLHEALATELVEAHYDPAYARWSRNHPRPCLEVLELDTLSSSSITDAATRVVRILQGMAQ